MKILNYLRYLCVILLLGLFFYNYTITIDKETIKDAIDRKMPMVIEKKGFVITLNDIHIDSISNNVVKSKIIGIFKVNNFLKKILKKSMNLTIITQTKPKIIDSYLSFELLSLNINNLIKMKDIKGLLKKKIENVKVPIKKLKKFSWFSSVKKIRFQDNGGLKIDLKASKLIIFLLIPLFLLREIGLFLIFLYQKLLSQRKSYKCAKGELYQNGTCSSTTKEVFRNHGFIAGIKEYRKSTKECKTAYKKIKDKERTQKDVCDAFICSGCSGAVPTDVLGSSAGLCDVGGCVTAPCDVGSC